MKVEVREDSVFITGYVNAIERFSKPIKENLRGKVRTFIERIKAGVFKTALKRNDDVKVLLNHNHDRVLATTKDGSAKLEEDNIGLRAEVTITDKEVVEKARNNQLVGWSFGFYANSDELGTEGNNETRTVTDLDLIEVSILDDTKSPAYYGTSIEARSENEKVLEYRATIEEIQEEAMQKHEEVYKITDKMHQEIEQEKKEAELELIVEKVVMKVLEKLNGTGEEKTIPEKPVEEDRKVEEENRSTIDYSEFEKRIANLK
jgi:HK97 family phage prohead protease